MSDGKKDYYTLLGVTRDASPQELKRAFRALAKDLHPDRSSEPDAEERFKEVAEAYGVLSDADKRSLYDRGGHAALDGSGGQARGGFGDGFGFGGIFDQLFGGGRRQARRSGPRDGRNVVVEVSVPLALIAEGGRHELHLARMVECERCDGSRAEPGTSPQTCRTCEGSGQRVVRHQRGGMLFQQVVACDTCDGTGQSIASPCTTCTGRGKVQQEQVLRLKVPAGIKDGAILRIAGEGEASPDPGGRAGDLHVVVEGYHEDFERRGQHLVTTARIDVIDAALGTELTIAAPTGEVTVAVPAGTQSGATLRRKGAGLPQHRGHGRGDLYVLVELVVPQALTTEQRAAWQALRAITPPIVEPDDDDGA